MPNLLTEIYCPLSEHTDADVLVGKYSPANDGMVPFMAQLLSKAHVHGVIR